VTYVPNVSLSQPHIIRPNRFYSALGQRDLETVGDIHFSDSFRVRADFRQLPERMYLPDAARFIRGAPGLRVPALRESRSLL